MRVELTPRQSQVFTDPARFRSVIAGRRSGKTFEECVELNTHAMSAPDQLCWYVAPTYRQAKTIAWSMLKGITPRANLAKSPNETELSQEYKNGSKVQLRGADNPDSLRGPGLNFLVMDEYAFIDPRAWGEVLRPALSDTMGRALFTSTPAGFNWAYDLFMRGKSEDPSWSSHQYTTAEGGIVPLSEVEEARQVMDPRQFRQEYEASFEVLAGRVYDMFDRDLNVTDVEDLGGDLLVGMDFNINPMSCVFASRAVDECHVWGELEVMTSNTEELAAEIRHRYPDRSVVVCPDASGGSRRTSAPVGQTDYTILERRGFQIHAPAANPPVKDRINNMQAMLLNGGDKRRLLVHPSCTKLIRALDGMTYKEGTSQPDKTLGLDHITDALGYLCWSEFNVVEDRTIGVRTFRY